MPCTHNAMVANDEPGFAWKCADCGHVYGKPIQPERTPMDEALKVVLDRLEFYMLLFPDICRMGDEYWQTQEGQICKAAILKGRAALKAAGHDWQEMVRFPE